jgi:asparagine synthase (glutamine-hydrolysing)
MCGIAGIVWNETHHRGAGADVAAMCAVLSHRGPDAEAHYVSGPVALGHRRLAILDLSEAGTQPLASHDGRFVIVFNGEIYNYLELRAELTQLGSHFRTQTDTEVILEAYRCWGSDCVSRFNGMWAFALYDTAQEVLFLSRDRFGIKPLYYLFDRDSMVFASELKAILAVRPMERRPHSAVLARFVPGGAFADGEETFFANIRSLLPAHNAIYDVRRGSWTTRRYWSIEPERFAASLGSADPVEVLRELLWSAVRLHVRSDVPVGTCLSGGLDSSLVVCLMGRLRSAPVHTFSAIYADKECNEKRYVDAINGHADTFPCPVHPEPEGDLVRDLTAITWHQDGPTAGPGVYTQYHVMRRAGRDVKVVLDGQGADELFAGYLWYFGAHLLDLAQHGRRGRIKALALQAAICWHWGGATVPPVFDHGWNARLQRLLRRKVASPATVGGDLLYPEFAVRASELPPAPAMPGHGHLDRLLCDQLTRSSLPALLHYEDRNSMAFSLEARVPFLDYRIVELALALGTEHKISSSWTKWVLRQAAAGILPRRVRWRRSKLGYPTPMARWFRKPSERVDVEDVLFSRRLAERELVRPEVLRRVWELHQAGQDHSWLLYRVLTMELWHRHFVDALAAAPARQAA